LAVARPARVQDALDYTNQIRSWMPWVMQIRFALGSPSVTPSRFSIGCPRSRRPDSVLDALDHAIHPPLPKSVVCARQLMAKHRMSCQFAVANARDALLAPWHSRNVPDLHIQPRPRSCRCLVAYTSPKGDGKEDPQQQDCSRSRLHSARARRYACGLIVKICRSKGKTVQLLRRRTSVTIP
jgi:hypothetical protein